MTVARDQRFTRGQPCPVCGGHDTTPRGQEQRCWGFRSSDGTYAHCTRDEHAGGLEKETSGTYAHRLDGECRCGAPHGVVPSSHGSPAHDGIAATYPYRDEAGALLFECVRLAPKGFRQRRPDGKGGWIWNLQGVRRVLYRLPEALEADAAAHVFVVEGEKDVETARRLGLVATCNAMGAGKWAAVAEHAEGVLRGRHVVVIADKDKVGRDHAAAIHASLEGVAASVVVREVPQGKDLSEWVEQGADAEAVRALATTATAPTNAEPEGRIKLQCVADIAREQVKWLWTGRVPFGKVTLLDGDPGLGKSLLTCELAAAVTRGRPLRGDLATREPASVIMLSAEDGVGDTIRPRLEAAGADVQRVHVLPADAAHAPSIPGDLIELGQLVMAKQAWLLIVDPLMAFLASEIDAHKDQHARRAMSALARMAASTGAAIVVVRHLNKAAGASAVYRGGGSIGIAGAARSVLAVAKDRDDESLRHLAQVKSNLGARAPTLSYRVGTSAAVPVIEWQAGEQGPSADELFAAEAPRRGEQRRDASQLLREELASGSRPARDVEALASEAGITPRTLRRAADDLGVESRPGGYQQPWEWTLPASTDSASLTSVGHSTEVASSSKSGGEVATSGTAPSVLPVGSESLDLGPAGGGAS